MFSPRQFLPGSLATTSLALSLVISAIRSGHPAEPFFSGLGPHQRKVTSDSAEKRSTHHAGLARALPPFQGDAACCPRGGVRRQRPD